MKNFSVNIYKIWYSVTDGQGRPTDWIPMIDDVKEGTLAITQGTPSVTPLKNELGQTKASKIEASQKEIALEIIGLDPNLIQKFAGGTSTNSGDTHEFKATLAPNSLQRLGIMALSDNNVLYELPYVEFSAAPQIDNTADGQRFVVNGAALYPLDGTTSDFYFTILNETAAKKAAITAFTFANIVGNATINSTAKTVTATVSSAGSAASITPHITVSKGAYVSSPYSGETKDLATTTDYVVEAADGTKETWKVKVNQG